MPDKQVRAARCAAIVAVLMALWLGGRAWASTTATVTLGGAEQSGDSGNITLSFNGFSETVEYGQYSTSASIASAFGGMFSRDDLPSGLCANASGAVVTFTLQSGSFGTLNVTGSTASFQVNSSGFSSQTGGQAADSGTVTLTVGGVVAAQTNYGSESTQASVASGLAAGVTPGSYVSVTASGNALQLQSKQTGAGTNYSYTLATTSYDTAEFSQPSFMNPPASGSLSGGSNGGGGSPQTVYSYTGSYDHHSNVLSYNDAVMGAWSFGYDNLSRVLSGSPASGNSSNGGLNLCWSYDSFGNRTAQDSQSAACPALPTLPAATAHYNANNQVSWTQVNGADAGFTYDAAGNVTYDNVYQYLYDAEGRICAVENTAGPSPVMTGYLYDAEGNRIAKGTIQNMTSCDPAVNGFVASSEVDSIRDQNGQQMAEATINAGSGTMVSSHANVWAAGQLLATYAMNQTGTPLSFYFNDPLGTRRIETDYQGTILQNCSSLPFGDGETCLPTPTEHLFTQKERDAETGNDYFGARYYGSNMGRFMSPDPSQLVYADQTNPQSLNLYSYVRNNPLINTDPTGMECVWDDGSYDSNDDPDTGSYAQCQGPNGAGGTWVDHSFFQNANNNGANLPDWSPDANSSNSPTSPLGLANLVSTCTATILNATNSATGGQGFTSADVTNNFYWGGAVNIDVTATNLPAAQFNAVQQTRYLPGTFLGNVTGAAPSVHMQAGPGNGSPAQDSPQTVPFTKTNVGGTTTVSTSVHIDSALSDAAHPIGAAIHGMVDVNGAATRNPCP